MSQSAGSISGSKVYPVFIVTPASLRLSEIFCPTNGSQSRRTVGFCSTKVTREPKFQASEHR